MNNYNNENVTTNMLLLLLDHSHNDEQQPSSVTITTTRGAAYVTLALFVLFTLIAIIAGVVVSNLLVRPEFYLGSNSNSSCRRSKRKSLAKNLPDYDGDWRIDMKRNGLGNPKSDLALDYEDVEFPLGSIALPGNTTLRGWFIPAVANNKNSSLDDSNRELCVVVCHGGGRDRRQHLRHVPVLIKNGAAVLLFDKQEHGISDGQKRGIGWFSYEGSDMFAACKYAKWDLKFKKVVAMGTSFGAAGALTATGHFDESGPNQVIDAVIAENPPYGRFRFVRDCMHMNCKSLPAFARDILALSVYTCLSIRRANLTLPDPSETIKNIAPRPLLITHGITDSIVPFEHGLELYEQAMEPKDYLWVPNCAHTMIFNRDPVGWEVKVSTLLQKVRGVGGGIDKSTQFP